MWKGVRLVQEFMEQWGLGAFLEGGGGVWWLDAVEPLILSRSIPVMCIKMQQGHLQCVLYSVGPAWNQTSQTSEMNVIRQDTVQNASADYA